MKCQITLSPCRCSGGPLFVFSLSLTAKLKVLEGSTYVLLALVLCHQCCKIMHFTQQTFLILARHKRGSVSFFLFSFTPLLQWWFPVPNPFTVFPKETTVSQREREREAEENRGVRERKLTTLRSRRRMRSSSDLSPNEFVIIVSVIMYLSFNSISYGKHMKRCTRHWFAR